MVPRNALYGFATESGIGVCVSLFFDHQRLALVQIVADMREHNALGRAVFTTCRASSADLCSTSAK